MSSPLDIGRCMAALPIYPKGMAQATDSCI